MKRFPSYIIGLLCVLTGCLGSAAAQDEVVFSAQVPREVYAGEDFDVAFVINSQGSHDFKAPSFKGFDILYGPAQSQSSSFSFINGQMQQSFSLSFSYRLRAPKSAGDFRFEAASIYVKDKLYKTEPLHIKVLPARKQNQGQGSHARSQRSGQSGHDPRKAVGEISNDDVFIRCIVNKNNPYVGEEVVVTYRIYTAVTVKQYTMQKLPSNKGFWSEELKPDENEQRETINGRPYVYVDLRKVALFPQESGKITIEPLEIEVVAAIPQRKERERTGTIFDFFDDPFFNQVYYAQATLRSKPVVLNVRPLPEAGKPADFNGVVGDYTVSFQYDKSKELKANEAINFKFNVSGQGSLELIPPPHILFPPDFEVYEPRVSLQKTQEQHVGGEASIEYIVVPRNAGIYRIPAFTFSHFDPKQGRYKTANIPETVLNIQEGSGAYTSGGGERDVNAAAATLLPLQTHAPHWSFANYQFFLSAGWWLTLVGVVIAAAAGVLVYRRRKAVLADVTGLRNKRAAAEARRCLKKAHLYMTQNKKGDFYIEISQALWGFLSHKFNIPVSDLSIAHAQDVLQGRGLSAEVTQAFIQTLDHCEFERFAPQGNSRQSMAALYEEALNVISSIVKELHA